MSTHTHASGWPERHRLRLGGSRGNEILTSVNAAVLIALIGVQLLTVLALDSMIRVHLFVGVVLLGPVALKLGSTGYRFARYYTGSRLYREKGPPQLGLRVLAPILVFTTIGVLATGIWLLSLGHRNGTVIEVHKVFFILWGVVFGLHFLFYLPRVVRSLADDWSASSRQAVPGAGLRATLLALALGGGLAVALALASAITSWQGGHLR